jgi:aminopeptidase
MPLSLQEQLQNYAELIVRVGANVQPGQTVLFRAPVEGAELARMVVRSAYAAGARYVNMIWTDDDVTLAHFENAADETFDAFPGWLALAHNEAAERHDATIEIRASDPALLKDQNPDKVARAAKARRLAVKPFMDAVTSSKVNWCLVSMPIESWAKQVYPTLQPAQAMEKLWQAILKSVRADQPNAAELWREHLARLEARRSYLTDKAYQALHYRAPGTDLTVGLPEGHLWLGGYQDTQGGITYVANLPTEEVFTLPHKDRVDGVVKSTMPLSYNGNLIEDFSFTFKDGRVVEARAKTGQAILETLLATDEGARRLGEVALVPHSSPIAQMNTLFYNTLYDENASCHLALGRAYAFTLKGGTSMRDDEAAAHGANLSLEHVDFMIGSSELDVDGITQSGAREPIMRQGEFVF